MSIKNRKPGDLDREIEALKAKSGSLGGGVAPGRLPDKPKKEKKGGKAA